LTGTVSNDLVQGTTYVATYAYDAAGNRTQWTGNDNRQTDAYYDGFVASYSYNSANQLTALDWNTSQSEYDYEESYRYDANGNRTHSERTDHTRVGGRNYGYVWGQEWGYDDENHLTSQTNYRLESDGTRTDYDRTTHQYDSYPLPFDARGRRLASEYQRDVNDPSVDSERNEFLYSGLDLLAEYWLLDASTPSAGSLDSTADTNTYRTEYTLANLQPQAPGLLASQAVPIARTEYPTDGSISHLAQRTDYFHPDGRGNVAGYTNGDGYTQQTYAYDAFGQELPNAASGDAGRAERDLNNIRFASKPFTPTPGAAPSERDTLQYYGARYYDNALAQWATADSYRGTLSLPETLLRYAFVGNHPTAGGEWYGWCLNELGIEVAGPSPAGAFGYCSLEIAIELGVAIIENVQTTTTVTSATTNAVGQVTGASTKPIITLPQMLLWMVQNLSGDTVKTEEQKEAQYQQPTQTPEPTQTPNPVCPNGARYRTKNDGKGLLQNCDYGAYNELGDMKSVPNVARHHAPQGQKARNACSREGYNYEDAPVIVIPAPVHNGIKNADRGYSGSCDDAIEYDISVVTALCGDDVGEEYAAYVEAQRRNGWRKPANYHKPI
jgi:hypothetical protein